VQLKSFGIIIVFQCFPNKVHAIFYESISFTFGTSCKRYNFGRVMSENIPDWLKSLIFRKRI